MKGPYYESGNQLLDEVRENWNKYLKTYRVAGIILSILMIVVGALCFVFPIVSTYVLLIVASVALLVFGIWEVAMYISSSAVFRSGAFLVSGILNVILAIMLLFSPAETVLAVFGFLFAFNLLMVGFEQVTLTGRLHSVGVQNTTWVTVNGVINIVAGILLFFMPAAGALAMTLILAFYLVFAGITLLIECINAKSAA